MALTAVDTNVVVRLLTRDDEVQFRHAERCFSDGDVFLPDSVLLETAWVLASAYSFDEAQIATALRHLLGLPNVRVAAPARIFATLQWYERGLDFADALHLAASQQASRLHTFDRNFIRDAAGLGACPVVDAAQ